MSDTDDSCKRTISINQILKYLFKFHNRTKIQSHINSHITIEKPIKSEILKLRSQTKS